MHLTPIPVESSASEENDQIPRQLKIEGASVEVGEILDRWYQGPGNPEWPPANYFRVIGYNFKEYLLKHDLEAGQWYLVERG